jgi:hypothetical protein
MNIFVLDSNPVIAAKLQHDRHVVKMSLEACQMLSVACKVDGLIRDAFLAAGLPDKHQIEQFNLLGSIAPEVFTEDQLYAVTHQNHPASIWVREHPANFAWLAIHLDALMSECHHRWPGKIRKCDTLRFHFGSLAAKLSGLPHPTKPHRSSLGFYTDSDDKRCIVNPRLVDWAMRNHTPFVFCGPDCYHWKASGDSVVLSYQDYYIAEKVAGNRWTNPSTQLPDWLAAVATIHTPVIQPKVRRRQPKAREPFVIPPPHTQVPAVANFLSRLSKNV